MCRIAHLSDLHFRAGNAQSAIFDGLVAALRAERAERGAFDLLVFTGDIFDDGSSPDARSAARSFATLHERLLEAGGRDCVSVIVPGNHDRRRLGLLAPHRVQMFDALRSVLEGRAWVHGCSPPLLADVIEPSHHGLPLWLIAYDSSFLPRGWLSAGGMVRKEDLLYAAAKIGRRNADWPIVMLLHHHLVPTPLTDLHPVEAEHTPALVRFGLERVLPALFAHADREELTMTALGAGTAISTLHALGRAVLVLHGHKHIATVRMLDATVRGHGDVVIASAGSAGMAQEWTPGALRGTARLWPSFNVVALKEGRLTIDTVSFGYKGRSAGRTKPQPLLVADKRGAQWHQEPIEPAPAEPARLSLNSARFHMVRADQYWDYECDRRIELAPGARLSRYVETIIGEEGAELTPSSAKLPTEIELGLGRTTRYRVRRGAARILNGSHHTRADYNAPFSWVGLMNRYACDVAEMIVSGLGDASRHAFATITDLGTGLERPLDIGIDAGAVIARADACPARSLLRVYWPLVLRARVNRVDSVPHDIDADILRPPAATLV